MQGRRGSGESGSAGADPGQDVPGAAPIYFPGADPSHFFPGADPNHFPGADPGHFFPGADPSRVPSPHLGPVPSRSANPLLSPDGAASPPLQPLVAGDPEGAPKRGRGRPLSAEPLTRQQLVERERQRARYLRVKESHTGLSTQIEHAGAELSARKTVCSPPAAGGGGGEGADVCALPPLTEGGEGGVL